MIILKAKFRLNLKLKPRLNLNIKTMLKLVETQIKSKG